MNPWDVLQLYAFASTYALGKRLNRTPIFQRRDPCQRGLEEEVRDVFPNFHAVIYPFVRTAGRSKRKNSFPFLFSGCARQKGAEGDAEDVLRLRDAGRVGGFSAIHIHSTSGGLTTTPLSQCLFWIDRKR